jgi:hypothetical protein
MPNDMMWLMAGAACVAVALWAFFLDDDDAES